MMRPGPSLFFVTVVVIASPSGIPSTARAQSCAPIPANIVSWWRAEGTAADAIDGNAGSLQGGTFFTTGRVGQTFTFDSNDDRVVVAHNANLNATAPGFTVEFWMKGIKNQPASLYAVVEKSHGFIDFTGWAIQGDSTPGTISFVVGNGSSFPAVDSAGFDVLDGVFHHVAGVWDGASILLYVDGILRKSTPFASAPAGNTRGLNLGYAWGGGTPQRFFRGALDELATYARALSASEIQAIYAAGVAGKCSPCGNGLLNPGEQCDDGNVLSGDCCSSTCAFEAAAAPCTSDGQSCTTDRCDGAGSCLHVSDGTCPCAQTATGLVAWWPGEGNAADASGTNAGTLVNGTTFAAGKVGQAFSFDGIDDAVAVPNSPSLNLTGSAVTVSLWAKGSAPQGAYAYLVSKSNSSGGSGYSMYTGGDATLYFFVGTAGTIRITPSFGFAWDNQFHLLTGVYDGATVSIWVDGVRRAQVAATGAIADSSTSPLNLGRFNGVTSGFTFRGVLDEVQVYNRALSGTEIRAIYQASASGECSLRCGDGIPDAHEQCDDGNLANGDCCSATCQLDPAGAACSDSNACTYGDTCNGGGVCSGTPVTCTSDECNARTCNGTATCTVAPRIGNGCDDGNACTFTDTCNAGGICVGTPITCAPDQCNTRTCNGTGTCSVTPLAGAACTDGDPCTYSDVCSAAGACAGTTVSCPPDPCNARSCNGTPTCSVTPITGAGCDDGDRCTRTDTCQSGVCVGGDPVVCAAVDQCHDAGTCQPATGSCSQPPKPSGTACDDANACSLEDTCTDGTCTPGALRACDDGNPCTTDACDPATGQCRHDHATAPCDDENPCTTDDACDAGACVGVPVSCDDGQFCNGFETCDFATGDCVANPPPSCDDGLLCTSDRCDATALNGGTCLHDPIPDCCSSDAQCDDGAVCNGPEACDVATGRCLAGAPVVCDDGDACTTDACDSQTGLCIATAVPACCNVDADCSDGDPCTTDACDVAQHVCTSSAVVCGDGLHCNGDETCNPATGLCVAGTPPQCDDGIVCTADTCDEGSHACTHQPIPGCCDDDADCGDGDICDGIETCEVSTGRCRPGTRLQCDDGDPCNGLETCDPGDACRPGAPPACDDSAPCTADLCDPAFGCHNPPIPGCCVNDGDCDDGDVCNGLETCVDARCVAGAAPVCDDDNPCTKDSCDPLLGCRHVEFEPAGTPCGDPSSQACDAADACDGSGTCQPNHLAVGTPCGDAEGACVNQDTCDGDGTCRDGGFKPAGTGCGDPSSGSCDAADTCSNGGICRPNHVVAGAPCGDGESACVNADACDGNGACHDNGFKAAGTSCGDPSSGACDAADTCDGGGACEAHHAAPGAPCGDAGSACVNQDTCDGDGACHDNGFKGAGTGCGDPSSGPCDVADSCDGGGTCRANHAVPGTPCGDAGGECVNQDTCDGAGACADSGYKPAGSACGDLSSGACDAADTCNGHGACQPNHVPLGAPCGDAGGECVLQDVCDGNGGCHDNGFKDAGTACGDPASGVCDAADTCNGSGSCEPNHAAGGSACADDGNPCTTDQCDETGACTHAAQPTGVPCDDGNACTLTDTCTDSGTCSGGNFSWSDYLQPINVDGSSIFKLGSTIPVKFRLTDACSAITDIVARIYVAKIANSVIGTELEAVSTAAADSGNTFRYDPGAGQYIFNLSTKAMGTAGTWQIRTDLGDGVGNRTVVVSLKK